MTNYDGNLNGYKILNDYKLKGVVKVQWVWSNVPISKYKNLATMHTC